MNPMPVSVVVGFEFCTVNCRVVEAPRGMLVRPNDSVSVGGPITVKLAVVELPVPNELADTADVVLLNMPARLP